MLTGRICLCTHSIGCEHTQTSHTPWEKLIRRCNRSHAHLHTHPWNAHLNEPCLAQQRLRTNHWYTYSHIAHNASYFADFLTDPICTRTIWNVHLNGPRQVQWRPRPQVCGHAAVTADSTADATACIYRGCRCGCSCFRLQVVIAYVGLTRTFLHTPYMTVYLVNSLPLPKTPYMHPIYVSGQP